MDTSPDDVRNKFSEPFVEMAARIERNLETEFAGAVLIVPPTGEPIAVLMTDPDKDLEAFWAMANGRVQVATAEFMSTRPQTGAGFGRR